MAFRFIQCAVCWVKKCKYFALVENIPELKTVMREINESELTSAFGKAFAKKAAVMFRLK